MKRALTVLSLFLTLALLFINCEKKPEITPDVVIPDDDVVIPDNNFLNALIEQGVDKDGNGIISQTEAEVVTNLDVSGADIYNMTGIEAFVNLASLICQDNQLTSLDLSGCTALEGLYCSSNQLTSLDVSGCTALTDLHCSRNQLTSLDVSNNTNLTRLLIEEMPALFDVCVWTMPFPPAGVEVFTLYSPNVYFTTDCGN